MELIYQKYAQTYRLQYKGFHSGIYTSQHGVSRARTQCHTIWYLSSQKSAGSTKSCDKMLTKVDFHHNLQISNVGCKLGILPLELNSQTEQLELLTSTRKRIVCCAYFALYTIHTAYIASRLPYLQSLWNIVRSWTLQELLAMSIFYCLAAAVTLMLAVYWFREDMSLLIYSSLTEEHQPRLWFMICFFQEANLMLFSLFSTSFIFQLHTLLPGTLGRVLKGFTEAAKGCRGSFAVVNKIVQQIHVVQLLVNLFNEGHRNVTYCIKLVRITFSIVNGYGAIVHGGEDVVFLLLTFAITFDTAFFYALMYEKAFAIPDGLQRVKWELTVEIQGIRNDAL